MARQHNEFPWHLVLIVLIVMFIWLAPPLMRSPRPSKTLDRSYPLPRSEDVQARLWQDPFEAVAEHKHLFKDDHTWEHLQPKVAPRLSDPNIVIVAIVPSSGYAEDIETRLRSRYSIVAGLLASKFSPDNESHIGFLDLVLEKESHSTNLVTVPYETFSRRFPGTSTNNSALLLWLQQDDIAERPLSRLDNLIETLLHDSEKPKQLAIIGPRDSTTLRQMVFEADNAITNRFRRLIGASILSPWATAPDYILFSEEAHFDSRERTKNSFFKCGITFQSFSATDDQVLRELVWELETRRVDIVNGGDQIVLISEADTSYGRTLPQVFRDELRRTYSTTNVLPRVHNYYYFRGLDGSQTEEALKQQATADGRRGIKLRIPDIEEPHGQAQYDYVRRLVNQIETDMSITGTSRSVKAIGVLGSDPYDKIVLLQILRKRFPGVIFFTTDLDSRFHHPSQLDWTRNLIVASGRDLQPWSQELRAAMPPFRDSYQTAQYLATLQALKSIPRELQGGVLRPGAKVFEIGRTGPVLLRGEPEFPDVSGEFSVWQEGIRVIRQFIGNVLIISLFLILSIAMFLPFSTTLRRLCCEASTKWFKVSEPGPPIEPKRKHEQHVLLRLFLEIALIFSLFFAIILEFNSSQLEEPLFPLFNGISVWPSEIIRIVAIMVSLYFFYRMRWIFKSNCRELQRDMILDLPINDRPSDFHAVVLKRWLFRRVGSWKDLVTVCEEMSRAFKDFLLRKPRTVLAVSSDYFRNIQERVILGWNAFVGYRRGASISFWVTGENVSASSLFGEYIEKSRLSKRIARVVSMLPVVVVLAIMVFLYSIPTAPIRGSISAVTDILLDIASGLCFIVLLLAVFDGVRLCTRFVQLLGAAPTTWPENLLKSKGSQYNIDEEHLSGWLDVKIVAAHTEAIMGMVYYPFIVLFLLCAARHPFFDDWTWPPSVIAFVSLSGALALWNVLALRRAAHAVKVQALTKLNESVLRASDDREAPVGSARGPSGYSKLKTLRDWVADETHGAYGPISRDPLIGAILVPTGGAGLISLIEAFMK